MSNGLSPPIGYYMMNVSWGGGAEEILVNETQVLDQSYIVKTHSFDIWGAVGQGVTVRFYTRLFIGDAIWSRNYNMSYEDVRWWIWTTWYPETVRPSFSGSSLQIDNYEPSLYMGTVQAYIQGLEQGSIDKNCTFIDIQASPTTFSWEDDKRTLTRMISYKAPDGKYYTTVTKIQGDIYGTGPKDIKYWVYEGAFPFDEAVFWAILSIQVTGLVIYIGAEKGIAIFVSLKNVADVIKLIELSISPALASKIRCALGWIAKKILGSERIATAVARLLSHWGISRALVGAIFKACIVSFMCAMIAYHIGWALGWSERTRILVAAGVFFIALPFSLLLFGVSLGPIGWLVLIIIGVAILVYAYFTRG